MCSSCFLQEVSLFLSTRWSRSACVAMEPYLLHRVDFKLLEHGTCARLIFYILRGTWHRVLYMLSGLVKIKKIVWDFISSLWGRTVF